MRQAVLEPAPDRPAPTPRTRRRIAIVGGGLAGLTAAVPLGPLDLGWVLAAALIHGPSSAAA